MRKCGTMPKSRRKEALTLLKSLGRFSVTYGELRHFSGGNLRRLADGLATLTSEFLSVDAVDDMSHAGDKDDTNSLELNDMPCTHTHALLARGSYPTEYV